MILNILLRSRYSGQTLLIEQQSGHCLPSVQQLVSQSTHARVQHNNNRHPTKAQDLHSSADSLISSIEYSSLEGMSS
jgi:hypothetical protein